MKRAKAEIEAEAIAKRLDQARELGEQLTFLPSDDGEGGELVPEKRGAGRPKGAKNKSSSQLKAMLAAKGFRQPEDVLALMAGLDSRLPPHILAMQRAEEVLAWAGGQHPGDFQASVGQRLAVFTDLYKDMGRRAEAVLPFGLGKVTPDVNVNTSQITQIVMPGGSDGPAPTVIEGRKGRAMSPPPMPKEIVQNQAVSEIESGDNLKDGRTI